MPPTQPTLGRPESTSHAEIEQAALRLFSERGFEGTTMSAIAEAVGVGRRTLYRYSASQHAIPWGQFDETLTRFTELLEASPPDLPPPLFVHRGRQDTRRVGKAGDSPGT